MYSLASFSKSNIFLTGRGKIELSLSLTCDQSWIKVITAKLQTSPFLSSSEAVLTENVGESIGFDGGCVTPTRVARTPATDNNDDTGRPPQDLGSPATTTQLWKRRRAQQRQGMRLVRVSTTR